MANRKRQKAPASGFHGRSPGDGLPFTPAPKSDEGIMEKPGMGFCDENSKGTGRT